ncbi:DUF397 domain-containing protein [Streptomyces physcomitrii]|uniref:DUF397 domain-containing protein n=1 Tax=Streptomyces physcomitrii TaxID=2724184 RepID=A0ABX1GUH2_9ACTN|nr:DUF397 domain-containing protein [Streptomyces physcomitrii]NKI39692.1 DUF397 domain-containing protein [Streptomyces physcomitrii]
MAADSPRWFTSSYSAGEDNCVEVADLRQSPFPVIAVRDSKAPTGPVLGLRADAFSSFLAGVKGGRLGAV